VSRLIAVGVGLAAILFFTLFANRIPQLEKHFSETVTVGAESSKEELAAFGETMFNGKGNCTTCHHIGALGARAPDLAGMGGRAAARVAEPGYTGEATDAEGYIRESLSAPCAYVVEGYECIMPVIDQPPVNLSPIEMTLVIAYIQSLGGEITVELPSGEDPAAAAQEPATPAPAATTPEGIIDEMGCGLCHTVPGVATAQGQVGPILEDMANRASSSLESSDYTGAATTPREYVREAILSPDAYLAPDCPARGGGAEPCKSRIMPPVFGEQLLAQQLETLIDFFLGEANP